MRKGRAIQPNVEKMRPLLEGARELKEIPRTQRLLHRPSPAKMFTKAVQGDKVLRDRQFGKRIWAMDIAWQRLLITLECIILR